MKLICMINSTQLKERGIIVLRNNLEENRNRQLELFEHAVVNAGVRGINGVG